MKTVKIFSKNAAYQKFEVLKTNRNKRYKYGEFFVEGVRNINEAIKNKWEISSFIYSSEARLSDWAKNILNGTKTEVNYVLTEQLMTELSEKDSASELLAVVKMRSDDFYSLKLSDNPVIVLFDRPSNKGNLGTMIRSCDGLGVDALILTGHGVDLYDPEVVTASMGSFFNLNVVRGGSSESLNEYFDSLAKRYGGLNIVGTTSHKEKTICDVDFTRPTVLMIGNETMGLSAAYKERCNVLATIPMVNSSAASSFNVSCAATVMLYEIARQRGFGAV